MKSIDRCISVGAHSDGRFTFPSGRKTFKWCMKEYQLERRKSDGAYTWRLVRQFNERLSDSMPSSLSRDAQEYADRVGLTFRSNVKHGVVAELTELELMALSLKGDV